MTFGPSALGSDIPVEGKGEIDDNPQTGNPYGPGNWTITFTPQQLGSKQTLLEIYHGALKGPAGSQFQMYRNSTFISASPRGDINEYDPSQPIPVTGSDTIYFYFNTGVTPAPYVTLSLRPRR